MHNSSCTGGAWAWCNTGAASSICTRTRTLATPKHLPAWAEFNRRIGGDGSVGIWHETYMVARDQYECIYVNMPRFGLGSAAEHLPITGLLDTARNRIGKAEPVTPGAANIGDQH